MKVEFLQEFEAKTTIGSRIIEAGTVLDLEEGKATRLINAGIVKAVDGQAVEAVAFNPDSKPYLDDRARLVIPFDCPPRYRWWQGGQSVTETIKEVFEERAAIMQYDGGLSREEAEKQAAILLNYSPEAAENKQ